MSFPTSLTTVALQPNFTTGAGITEENCYEFGAFDYTMTAVILILALIGNGFICVAFWTRRKLRTVTNYFVVNLAVADFLLIVQWMIWIVFYVLCVKLPRIPFSQTLEILFGSASVVSLGVVSYDRFYAVTRALHYGSTMTHRRALITIVAVWVYATVTAFVQLGALERSIEKIYLKVYIVVLFVFNFLLPFVVSGYCYASIFMIAMLHLRHGVPANQLSDPLSKASTVRKQLKISLNIFILAVPFLLIWNLFYGITVYEVMCDCTAVPSGTAEFFISNLPQIVAAINPVIFVCLTKDLRNFAMISLRCAGNRRRRRGDRFAQSESYPASTQYTTNYQAAVDNTTTKV